MSRRLNYRACWALVAGGCVAICHAETLVTDAKITQVTERGFVLKINTESLIVDDDGRTRFWRAKEAAKRDAFHEGDLVHVRVKKDSAPVVLREMADVPTGRWLEALRKVPTAGTIDRVEAKRVIVHFDDKSTFSYLVSDKTKVELKGAPASLTDLTEGMKVVVKAQLTSTLDTKATEISDRAIAINKPVKGKAPKIDRVKPMKLPDQGTIQGVVVANRKDLSVVDVDVSGSTLHVTLAAQTKTLVGTTPGSSASIQTGDLVEIVYRRNKFGAILAIKIVIRRP